ncbi:hypothetical protein QBC40DRAFT_325856 [Triangularia verruculosa]|uniref:RING-CH-type domain-containing protein n=1 Tax=Triangularia verruculosa TaxID=2587418 RepID=A0AAN6XTD7_9PEZI|nr:hypothetical protein QBC40DRAFT_325856 [Triangularia verruculosa]
MATASGTSTPAGPATPSASAVPSIVAAPYVENDQRVCFICLEVQNETDTPDGTWVQPCPCTLEAHQSCMLRWLAESEVSNGPSKNGLECGVCKAPITVEEPYDAIVALRNRFNRKISRIAPGLLVLIVSECSVVGAASYGFTAIAVFAGRRAVLSMVDKIGVIPTVITCSLIGPGLVLSRWLSSIGNVVMLPVSILYGTFLFGRNEPLRWPPSPVWAIALMPSLQFTYNFLYYEIFGKLERRLNRALRGRPMDEEPQNQAQQQQQPAADAAPANGQAQQQQGGQQQGGAAGGNQRQGEQGEEGMWDLVLNLARAVAGLFDDDDEVEVELDGPDDGAPVDRLVFEVALDLGANPDNFDDDQEAQDEDDQEELEHILHEHAADEAIPPPAAVPVPAPAAPPPAAQPQQQQQAPNPPPAQPPQQQQQPLNPPLNNNNNNRRRNRNRDNAVARPPPGPNGEGEVGIVSLFINSIVSSLLMPVISFGMGEAIRLLAPKSWVTRSLFFQRDSFWSSIWGGAGGRRRIMAPTGGAGGTYAPSILQHQWGRSLVGGCLYVVLRDAWALYVKWRRVQVKLNRRVKSVERRRAVGGQ